MKPAFSGCHASDHDGRLPKEAGGWVSGCMTPSLRNILARDDSRRYTTNLIRTNPGAHRSLHRSSYLTECVSYS
jgi:hypothetical protein